MGTYFSSLSGKQVDDAITALQNMCPQIIVINAGNGATVNCKCTAVGYNKTAIADSSGKCTFDIPEYGDYVINPNSDNVTQPMYVFKRVTVDLS